MRLTCPNCGAQYEVPENVMPQEGRDVQCSNCGTTWFQEHPDSMVEDGIDTPEVPLEDEEVAEFQPSHPAAEESAIDEPHPDDYQMPAASAPPEAEDAAPKRRELDPAVADVLRAEAELEEQARRNEAAAMESQPELGLDSPTEDAKKRAREARDRMARMRGEPVEPQLPQGNMPAKEGLSSRRDLLPDIEEINSTLRSNSDRSPISDPGQTAQIEVREKRSSRRGFTLTVLLISVLALTYVFAPQIAEAVPPVSGFLETYVSMIDRWRAWVDDRVFAMLSWLDAAAASSTQ